MPVNNLLSKIHIEQGDITKCNVDAIVNAANPTLLGGGGVDGAIHKAAGPDLLKECKLIGGCKHGEARITKGYNLTAKFIIHTPGPVYSNGKNHEEDVLISSYYNSIKLLFEYKLTSIAFPAISTGVYGYPKKEACIIAISTIMKFMNNTKFFPFVYFILFDNENFDLYNENFNIIRKTYELH